MNIWYNIEYIPSLVFSFLTIKKLEGVIRLGLRTEVISVSPKGNRVTISCGPYDITFQKNKDGKVEMVSFALYAQRMENPRVPSHFYLPALKRAIAVLRDRERRSKKRAKKEALQGKLLF